jgi:hypothetical protein
MKRSLTFLIVSLALFAGALCYVTRAHAQTAPAQRQVRVGNPTPVYTLADAVASIGTAGNVRIVVDPGSYVSPPFTVNASNVTIEAADPNNPPTIKFTLPKFGSGATFVNGTSGNTVRNIVFDLPNGETYALYPRGTNLTFENITVSGQGGLLLTNKGDVSRNLRIIRPKTIGPPHNHYAIYLGGDEQNVLIQDCDFVPCLWSAALRVMTDHNVLIKGGHISQDASSGMHAQAVQLRGSDGLTIDGLTIDSMIGGALDIGCLPWQEPGNLLPNAAVRHCTINGYILCQSGANVTFENNVVRATGNGGYVFGMQPPLSGVHRPTANGTIRSSTVIGDKLASHETHLKIGDDVKFNNVLLQPTPPTSNPVSPPPTQPLQP